jgi:hypothetical protein
LGVGGKILESLQGVQARRALLPCGKDIGDFVEAGGDLRAWIAGESARPVHKPDDAVRLV